MMLINMASVVSTQEVFPVVDQVCIDMRDKLGASSSKWESLIVMGWQNQLKFSGKTNWLKISLIFTILASFVCFFNFPDRNLIILYKITWKLPFCVR